MLFQLNWFDSRIWVHSTGLHVLQEERESSSMATLVGIQTDSDVQRMVAAHESEKKVRICVKREKACVDSRVSITPVKSSNEMARSESDEAGEGKYTWITLNFC